ncbi:hypothetical protein ACJX0J_025437 [Zea mays]
MCFEESLNNIKQCHLHHILDAGNVAESGIVGILKCEHYLPAATWVIGWHGLKQVKDICQVVQRIIGRLNVLSVTFADGVATDPSKIQLLKKHVIFIWTTKSSSTMEIISSLRLDEN